MGPHQVADQIVGHRPKLLFGHSGHGPGADDHDGRDGTVDPPAPAASWIRRALDGTAPSYAKAHRSAPVPVYARSEASRTTGSHTAPDGARAEEPVDGPPSSPRRRTPRTRAPGPLSDPAEPAPRHRPDISVQRYGIGLVVPLSAARTVAS
ncbi:hypothetical protein [Streptomyces sp. NPDC088146]|uniref:hypothetical protein n=1 Tax=Streptomyces sp. NPDC088146 TaxID=3365829 RepID=UPI00381C7C7C